MSHQRPLEADRPGHPHRHILREARSWLSRTFGVSHEARVAIVARMLEGHARSAPAYWLQLCVALALATLGVALNGPAVVIGAMLVSPLMGPIVELGMGLAVGSPLLSIRSLVRTVWSIVVVVGGATLITAALPFHEVTGEVLARASPTALDLLVAIFCAVAAAFTTLRTGTDATSAAAGTAVAIALVPPLCVVGFGIGTADRSIAGGAFLLFTANLCAILLVTALLFWLFAFDLVETHELEARRFERTEPAARSVRLAKLVFDSRFGSWLRVLLPLVLVATVWLPLTRALREVSWEVRTRALVQKILGELPLARTAVRSSLSLKHRGVHVEMVVVGKPTDARALQARLATRIAEVTKAEPTVEVVAVPDLETMEDVARTLARRELSQRPAPPDLLHATAEIAEALRQVWPVAAAGAIHRFRLDLTDREHPTLEIVHLGRALGEAGQLLLASSLSERLHAPLAVRELAIPAEAITATEDRGAAWLPNLASAVEWVRADQGLSACVTIPGASQRKPKRGRREDEALASIRDSALAELAKLPPKQVRWSPGPVWSVQVRAQPCETAEPSPTP